MKYIHDGRDFLAWFALDCQHSEMASCAGLQPSHAGFLQFQAQATPVALGYSGSLDLKSKPFEFPAAVFVAKPDWARYPVISNSAELLERMRLTPQPAVWVDSDEGYSGSCAVRYPTQDGLRHTTDEVNLR